MGLFDLDAKFRSGHSSDPVMHEYLSIPEIESAPAGFFDGGHLWMQEYVTGRLLRFRMDESGMIDFAGPTKRFDAERIPPHYISAVDTVRERLYRDRLRSGTDSVGSYTFFGIVPLQMGVEYAWNRIPAFLGIDIWDGTEGRFAPPDVTERVYDAIGLQLVPVFEKEVPASQFNPGTYSVPDSQYWDSTAAGVVLTKKTGEKAKVLVDSVSSENTEKTDEGVVDKSDLESALESVVSIDYLHSHHEEFDSDLRAVDASELTRHVAADIARRRFSRFRPLLEKHPDAFFQAIEARIRAIRADNL